MMEPWERVSASGQALAKTRQARRKPDECSGTCTAVQLIKTAVQLIERDWRGVRIQYVRVM